MPNAATILENLTLIANRGRTAAIVWHALVATALLALALGWRPSQRTGRLLIGIPLVSVASAAFIFANPFNGLVFAATAFAMTTLAARAGAESITRAGNITRAIGFAMMAFGLGYPHFGDGSALSYLYASPVGLIPCPTLAVAIGFALLGNGLGSRAWSLTLAGAGLFYGLFGLFRLGVLIDVVLAGGAVALAAVVLRYRPRALSLPL